MSRNKRHHFRRSSYIKRLLYSIMIALVISLAFFFHHTMLQNNPVPFVDLQGGATVLYSNQINDDLTNFYALSIASAKKSVFLNVYTLTDPTIINALKKKSEEGVDVRVITDAKESPYVTSKLGPLVSMIRRFSDGRMHQKILLIDGKISWIGSANMTSESLRMHGNLVSVVRSEPFSERIQAKALSMAVKGNHSTFPREDFNIDGQRIELWFLPDDQHAVQRIKELIRSAKKTIRIAMFTWTRMDFAHAVIEAANRGINVEVVIDSNQGKGASSRIVDLLKNSKVSVALSQGGPLLHHKFLYIDKTTLVNGSANWTRDAFNKNDECFLVINDLTLPQQQQMDSLWNVISKESIPVKKNGAKL